MAKERYGCTNHCRSRRAPAGRASHREAISRRELEDRGVAGVANARWNSADIERGIDEVNDRLRARQAGREDGGCFRFDRRKTQTIPALDGERAGVLSGIGCGGRI